MMLPSGVMLPAVVGSLAPEKEAALQEARTSHRFVLSFVLSRACLLLGSKRQRANPLQAPL